MPTFTYEALNAAGKPQKGQIDAGTSEEAVQKIKSQGLYPSNVKQVASAKKDDGGKAKAATKKRTGSRKGGKVGAKKLTLFTRQLSTLQDAGLPLLRSLNILESQQKPGKLKNVLIGVAEEVEGGSSLSEAMAKFPKCFNHLYTKMVAAGEVGGVLDVILQRLADFMEKSQKLKRKIRSALVYPAVVITIASLILTAIMVFIIPKFEEIFKDFGVALPGITMWLINTSRWFAGTRPGQSIPGWIIALPSPLLLFILYKLLRATKPGKAFFDTVFLYSPIFGKLVRKTVIARFTRTLGTLISAGVPILEAIKITKETCGNHVFEKALQKVRDSIREGESFAAPLRESKTCDAIVVNMIDVGEETGELDAMLTKIADNYDDEVDTAVASLVSLLEPLMVVFLGAFVGLIVVAMFLPLVKMISSLQGGGAV
jgi:type IV pilus assembly protein PilC